MTPIETSLRAGIAWRVPLHSGYYERITYDALNRWFMRERCGPEGVWTSRVPYYEFCELQDDLGSQMVGAKEERTL